MGAAIQGIVQGLTEFLPVSSSGHLELLSALFGYRGDLSFIATLHLGTFFAVFLFAFKKLVYALKHPKLILLLIVSTIPAVIVGTFFEDLVESFFTPSILPFSFSITAIFLLLGSAYKGSKKMDEMSWLDAVLIGIAQAVAIIPGISRSGITIASAMILGYDLEDSLYYSFLMSLPVTLGAGILKYQGAGVSATIGLLSSFVFGLLALFLIRLTVYKDKFHLFGYYLTLVAALAYFAR